MALPNQPITRQEQYLANIAGEGTEYPEPITREEQYLAYIADIAQSACMKYHMRLSRYLKNV